MSKNILFPDGQPTLTEGGLITPKKYITSDKASDLNLTLKEWSILFWHGVIVVDKTKAKEYEQFYCGSRTTYWRARKRLEKRGLL